MRHALPDAHVLAGMDVTQVRNTPFGRMLIRRFAGEGREFEKFVTATGFDPRRDISELVFSAGETEERWLVAARGSFPAVKLMALAKASGAEITVRDGIRIASSTKFVSATPGGKPMAFAFLSPTLALAGDDASVEQAVARRRTASGPPAAVARRAAKVASDYPAWFTAGSAAALMPGGLGPLSEGVMKTVDRASGGARFASDVQFSAELIERTPEDAQALAEVVRFLATMAGTRPGGGAADIAALLQGLKVTAEGNLVRVAGTASYPLIEALFSETEPPQ